MSEPLSDDQHRHDRRALYGISVAADLTGVSPQNLRVYEARGLISPARTQGGTRRYSDHDVARVERITVLLEEGLNLAGISLVLELQDETGRLRRRLDALDDDRRRRDDG